MREQEPNQAPAKDQAERSRDVNPRPADGKGPKKGVDEFRADPEVDGKTDSGPEPDVHDREIPPQQ